MNRIEKKLQKLNAEGKKAFITYITAGLPDMEGTKEIIRMQEQAGTDIIELGIPFSDPAADGPVIQEASYQSILRGTNLEKCFIMVEELRKDCQIPLVFMMYYNTILYYGLEKFAKTCKKAGVDGLVIPDLPFEEQGALSEILKKTEGAPILLQLVSPVSKQRIPMLLEQARGFVYCVSSMGVTGQTANFYREIEEYLKEVKSVSKIPVMIGFGIQNAEDVADVKNTIDGVIVGSHLVKLLKDNDYDLQKMKEYISEFKRKLNADI